MGPLKRKALFAVSAVVDRVFSHLQQLPLAMQPLIEPVELFLSLRRIVPIDESVPDEVGWKYDPVLRTAYRIAMSNKRLPFEASLANACGHHGMSFSGMSVPVRTVLLTALYKLVVTPHGQQAAKAST